jgi:hypothetical protein
MPMTMNKFFQGIALLMILFAPRLWSQAGPPFETDDPTPVDLGHYEAYIFGTIDGTGAELEPVGPAFEFNWGAVPNVHLHVILPIGTVLPSNNPAYLPGGTGSSAFGLTDMELGLKYGFIKQTKHRPQIGSFTMFEIRREVPFADWESVGSGISCPSGSKRSSALGACVAALAMRSFRRRNITTIFMAATAATS